MMQKSPENKIFQKNTIFYFCFCYEKYCFSCIFSRNKINTKNTSENSENLSIRCYSYFKNFLIYEKDIAIKS